MVWRICWWFCCCCSAGKTEDEAYGIARSTANANMPAVGSAAFNALLDKYSNLSIAKGGGAFANKSALYHAEGVYNFKNQIKFAELLVGGNIRQYRLISEGTLFADNKEGRNGTIPMMNMAHLHK